LREVLARVVAAGPDELALADTIGVAVPSDVTERPALARSVAGSDLPLRLHLHDTRHASISGAGGCPFARPRRATWQPRTWCTSSTAWASRPA